MINGPLVWQRYLGGSEVDRVYSIEVTNDNGCVATGYSFSNDFNLTENKGQEDVWIVRLNGAGDVMWQKSWGSPGTEGAFYAEQVKTGEYMVLALHSGGLLQDIECAKGAADIWLLNIVADDSTNGIEDRFPNFKLELYPNPAAHYIHFTEKATGKIYNQIGQEVISFRDKEEIHINHLANGIYHISFLNKKDKIIGSRSMVVSK